MNRASHLLEVSVRQPLPKGCWAFRTHPFLPGIAPEPCGKKAFTWKWFKVEKLMGRKTKGTSGGDSKSTFQTTVGGKAIVSLIQWASQWGWRTLRLLRIMTRCPELPLQCLGRWPYHSLKLHVLLVLCLCAVYMSPFYQEKLGIFVVHGIVSNTNFN